MKIVIIITMKRFQIVYINNIKILYYDIIDFSYIEGIDVNKTSVSKECITYHHWYFLYKGFKIQAPFCNGCHYVLMIVINFNDIANLNFYDVDYGCIIPRIIRKEATNLLRNADLSEKSGSLQNMIFLLHFFIIYKK